jgi:hypothetical protein
VSLQCLPLRDGATYDHQRDGERLHKQHNRVLALMRDQAWRTLSEISDATGDPPASVSARLRDLRKPKFGAHTVERKYIGDGLFVYRVIARPELVLT